MRKNINTKIEEFQELQNLVATKNSGRCKIFYISMKMVAEMYWLQFLQWANTSLIHIDHKNAILSYTWNGRLYRKKITHIKGPLRITSIHDENGTDIFEEIIPFLGPEGNWDNISYTPSFWKKQKITFILDDDTVKEYTQEQEINV